MDDINAMHAPTQKDQPSENPPESPGLMQEPTKRPEREERVQVPAKFQRGTKSTKGEIALRVQLAYEMILACKPAHAIRARLAKSNISQGTARKYIRMANELISMEGKEIRHEAYEKSIRQRTRMMEIAIGKGQIGLAHEIRRDLDRLLDLYPADRKKGEAAQGFAQFLAAAQRKLIKGKAEISQAEQAIEVEPEDETPDSSG